jgi:dihydroflavonol-4-reductase
LRDSASIEKALSGCDVVFHVAADYRLWVREIPTKCIARMSRARARCSKRRGNRCAARGVHVERGDHGLYFGHEQRERSRRRVAESPVGIADMIGHYKRSKFMAEQVAVEAARSGVDVVIVNPTTPIGERDIKPTPTGRIVVDFLKRKFPAYVETGLNLVDATECARGHIQALEKGRSGERYILGGENLTLKQILDRLAAITGLPSPTVKLPYIFALAAGVVDEMVTGTGSGPRAARDH